MRTQHSLEGYDPAVFHMAIACPEYAPAELKRRMVQAAIAVDNEKMREKLRREAEEVGKIAENEAKEREKNRVADMQFRKLMRDYGGSVKRGRIHIGKKILLEVATLHGVDVNDLKGPRKKRNLVVVRREYCYRAAVETKLSYPEIGRILGGRDHTTVIHSIARYCALNGLELPRGATWKVDERGFAA